MGESKEQPGKRPTGADATGGVEAGPTKPAEAAQAPASAAAAERAALGEAAAGTTTEPDENADLKELPEKGVDLLVKGREVERIRELVGKAKMEVIKIFRRATSGITTQRGEITADNMTLILRYPLDQLEKEWISRVRGIHADSGTKQELINLRGDYGSLKGKTGRIYDAVQSVHYYVEHMKKEKGWITPEKLAEISYSVSSDATVIADLLAEKGNQDLVEAFRLAIGMRGGAEAKDAAIEALKKHSVAHFPNDPLMKPTWMILSYTDSATRVAVAENFKAKKPAELANFLDKGNALGVYSWQEIEEISGKKPEEKEREAMALRWQKAHDFSEQTRLLTSSSYGVSNAASEMLTGKNILIFIGQVAAGATIAANLVVGVTKGGAWKSPAAMAQLATNHNILIAGAALGVIHHIKKGKRLGETFEGKADRDTHARRQAVAALRKEIRGNLLWPKWDEFFTGDGYAGARAFHDFVLKNKTKKDEFPEHKFTAMAFRRYLEAQQGSANPDHYAALIRKFEGDLGGADDKKVLALAKIFDHFAIGGAEAKDHYEHAVDEARKV